VRPWAPALAACLLLWASECSAVAPIFPSAPGAERSAAAGLAHRAPAKPSGVDLPERARALTSGQYRALVILLQFPDWPADSLGHPPSAYDSLLFGFGTEPTGTLREYYNEVSRGVFDIDGVVTRWVTAPRNYSQYTSGVSGFGAYPNNAQGMAQDAVATLDQEEPTFDFAAFDNDGPDGIPRSEGSTDDDGFIDALFIVHAGPGDEEMGDGNHIVSHKWNLPVPYTTHSGVKASVYTTEPERWQGLAPFTQPGALMSIGTFCHEFGHVLGLPDLYDTRSPVIASEGIGEWDLMGSGNYNHVSGSPLASSPAHMSAWCKARLGWVTPILVTQDEPSVTIPPVETSGTVYRLWTDGALGSEYFLIENRQPIGFDSGLLRGTIEAGSGAAHGLVILHINDAMLGNNNPGNKQVDVVESGGAEELTGSAGAQNLDVHRAVIASQNACGAAISVTGNRGDVYDPWPGPLLHTTFNANSCPSSAANCGAISQVAIRNILESGNDVTADFFVKSVPVRRRPLVVDDSPSAGTPNNGNGLAEPGETVRLKLPIENLGASATSPLTGSLESQDSYTALLGSSIDYGSIAPGAVDSGTVIEAFVNPAPDPRGAALGVSVFSQVGLVSADSVQILVGQHSGICEDFEGTDRRWVGVPGVCGSPNQWHREAGTNHTPGGTWAFKLGTVGPSGNYAPNQDTRLVSQPIRLGSVNDTLHFWQRYATELTLDGLTVEISTDDGSTWSPLTPVGGYPSGDRFSGLQFLFTEVTVPLTGYSGVVQIAFRFRSSPFNESGGWWIDDVVVTGDASCTTTAIAIARFEGAPAADRPGVRLAWTLGDAAGSSIGIDRAEVGAARRRLVTLGPESAEGSYLDSAVRAGYTYEYWLVASREGEPSAEAGPIEVTVSEAGAPRVLTLGPIRPNPFNPQALIPVSLDRGGRFVLRVYRADGTPVRTLAAGSRPAGTYQFTWNGTDDHGADVGTGVYLVELRSESRVRVQKAILLR
jgi:M6 family metalloprotease-like protein